MSILHRPEHRAPEDTQQAPVGFCDACGTAVYKADVLTVTEGQLLLSLHGTCADSLSGKIGDAQYKRKYGR